MILLTGATGKVGSAAYGTLLKSGDAFRVLVRDPQKLPQPVPDNVEIVVGDLANVDDVRSAMQGVDRAFLLMGNSEQQAGVERQFADAAVAGGVGHIVKLSSLEAGPDAKARLPRLHYESEQYIRSLDLAWTFVQPNFFMQNLLLYAASIAGADLFALPLGDAKLGMVDSRDVGETCARVLTGSGHENRTYGISGSELLTLDDVAARMSDRLDRRIRYIDQSPDEFRATLGQFLTSEWHLDAICELFAEIATGSLAELTPDAETLLGRAPITIDRFIDDFAGAFSKP